MTINCSRAKSPNFGDTECEVSVMIRAGKLRKWPNGKDEIFYPVCQLVRKIESLIIANSRGHFQFHKMWPEDILQVDFSQYLVLKKIVNESIPSFK